MRKTLFIILTAVACLAWHSAFAQAPSYPLPQVPSMLKTPQDRANYLAAHYWDHYDFADNSLIGSKDISEQGFSNFISIMPYVTEKASAFESLARRMSSNDRMFEYFIALAEKYLAEPLSPVYNEPLYILMLEKAVESGGGKLGVRERCKFDLKMARKNRIGTKATDFSFRLRNGKRSKLSEVEGEHILVFFGDPECDACVDAKNRLVESEAIGSMLAGKRLTILYVCLEGKTAMWKSTPAPKGWIDGCDEKRAIYKQLLYDVKAMPTLYLLDAAHNVVLKDVEPEHIASYLSKK